MNLTPHTIQKARFFQAAAAGYAALAAFATNAGSIIKYQADAADCAAIARRHMGME